MHYQTSIGLDQHKAYIAQAYAVTGLKPASSRSYTCHRHRPAGNVLEDQAFSTLREKEDSQFPGLLYASVDVSTCTNSSRAPQVSSKSRSQSSNLLILLFCNLLQRNLVQSDTDCFDELWPIGSVSQAALAITSL